MTGRRGKIARYNADESALGVSMDFDLVLALLRALARQHLEAELTTVDDTPLMLATPQTLYRMKRDTVRPIDRADAAALREKFGLDD